MMSRWLVGGTALTGLALAALVGFSPVAPKAWLSPANHLARDACLTAARLQVRPLGDILPGQPDGLAFSPDGKLLAALATGEVVAIDTETGQSNIVSTSDAFLTGLASGSDGTIFAVDERGGRLLHGKPGQTLRSALETVDQIRLSWANDVTILPDGDVMFTTTATGRSLDAFFAEVLEHRPSGLLVRYRPSTGAASLVRDGLAMTNGIAVARDGKSVLVAQSSIYGISKIGTDGRLIAEITGLPGFTGNIRASDRAGVYWLTLLSPRSGLIDMLDGAPYARRLLGWLPASMRPEPRALPCLIELTDESGRLGARAVKVEGPGIPTSYSTAIERNGRLYLSPASIVPGSIAQIYVGNL